MPIPFTPSPTLCFRYPFPQNLELRAGPWQIYPCPNGMPDSGEAPGFLALPGGHPTLQPGQAQPILQDALPSLHQISCLWHAHSVRCPPVICGIVY